MPTLVYKYGLLAPSEEADRVAKQMYLAHRYRNTLTEIERAKRAYFRDIVMIANPHLEKLTEVAKIADQTTREAYVALKQARANARSKDVPDALLMQYSSAKSVSHKVIQELSAARAAAVKSMDKNVVDELNEKLNSLRKSARKFSGVFWGTYQIVEDAANKSAQAELWEWGEIEPKDPRFVRWNREGAVSIQAQGGLLQKDLFNANYSKKMLRVDTVDEKAWYSESRSERRRLCRTFLYLRVGSKGIAPIWAKFPMLMHRPILDGYVIKRATVHLRYIGPRPEWTVDFTIESDKPRPMTCGNGIAAIDIGWRVIGDEIRIAVWRNDRGETGDVRLSNRLLHTLRKASELRSVRDDNFNAVKTALAASISGISNLPEWLAKRLSTMAQWRSCERMSNLAKEWKVNRFDGDAVAYDILEAWRYHDFHLWEWESSERSKSLRQRKNVYRNICAQIARTHRTVVLEEFNLSKMAKRAPVEKTDAENDVAKSNRQLVSTGEFRSVLINAVTARGGEIVKVSAVNSTRECSACGFVNTFDAAENLCHTCTKCGVRWDQDPNAATNLLERGIERLRDMENAATARKNGKGNSDEEVKESRWVRAKKARVEKEARMATARKTDGGDAK